MDRGNLLCFLVFKNLWGNLLGGTEICKIKYKCYGKIFTNSHTLNMSSQAEAPRS